MKVTLSKPDWRRDDAVKMVHVRENFGDEITAYTEQNPLTLLYGNAVFLVGPTGCGKSTYVEDQLIIPAAKDGKQVLYVSNRVANNIRAKKKLLEKLGLAEVAELYSDKGLATLTDLSPDVHVYSYQALDHMMGKASLLPYFK